MQTETPLLTKSPVRRPIFTIALWAVVVVFFGAMVIGDVHRIHRHETGDFVHFYYAGKACLHHQDPYQSWTRGYIYPPLLAYLYQPIGALPRNTAAAVMLGVNVAITLLTLLLLVTEFCRRFERPVTSVMVAGAVLLALLLNSDKVKGEWQMWQTDVWMLLLFAIGLRYLDRRPWLAGLALGMAINFKYLPLLFLPWFLLRRRWAVACWMLLFAALWAMAPAMQVGWHETWREWGVALGGLTHLAGSNNTTATGQTEIHGLADALSISITSAFARGFEGRATILPYLFALATGAAFTLAGMSIYGLKRLPLWVWPKLRATRLQQISRPWLAITGIEYALMVALVLAFSPQTNTRHLYDVLMLTSAAAVLLIAPGAKTKRWPLVLGCVLLVAGFVLPPGSRTNHARHHAEAVWLHAGGPCWCLLGMSLTLLWTGLSAARRDDLLTSENAEQQSNANLRI